MGDIRASAEVRAFIGAERLREQLQDHAPNAMGNFCFDVTLSYRRLELQRRVKAGL